MRILFSIPLVLVIGTLCAMQEPASKRLRIETPAVALLDTPTVPAVDLSEMMKLPVEIYGEVVARIKGETFQDTLTTIRAFLMTNRRGGLLLKSQHYHELLIPRLMVQDEDEYKKTKTTKQDGSRVDPLVETAYALNTQGALAWCTEKVAQSLRERSFYYFTQERAAETERAFSDRSQWHLYRVDDTPDKPTLDQRLQRIREACVKKTKHVLEMMHERVTGTTALDILYHMQRLRFIHFVLQWRLFDYKNVPRVRTECEYKGEPMLMCENELLISRPEGMSYIGHKIFQHYTPSPPLTTEHKRLTVSDLHWIGSQLLGKIAFLLETPAHLAATDEHKNTLLHLMMNAKRRQHNLSSHWLHIHRSIIDLLLVRGINIQARNEAGLRAFDTAETQGSTNTWHVRQQRLMQSDYTLSTRSVKSGNFAHIDHCLRHGAPVNWSNEDGDTIVHLLLKHRPFNACAIAEYVIAHGADTLQQNKAGIAVQDILDQALTKSDPFVVQDALRVAIYRAIGLRLLLQW